MLIDEGVRFAHAPDIVACKLDGGNALLDLASSDYYRLNSTATTIWECVGQGLAFSQIIERVLFEYEVEHDQCVSDVEAIIRSFMQANLIVVAD
jgi:hypothetical protein